MALTNDQLSERIQALEESMEQLATAINRLATKTQLNASVNIRQSEITDLQSRVGVIESLSLDQVVETGLGLEAHKVDSDAHSELDERYYTEEETDLLFAPLAYLTEEPIVFEEDILFQGAVNSLSHITISGVPVILRNLTPDGAFTIYIDVNGNDANPGTQAAPIKTLEELSRRMPLLSQNAIVQFGAGDFATQNFGTSPNNLGRMTWGTLDGFIEFRGAVGPTLVSFVVESVDTTTNTITAVGDPGWQGDSLVGYRIRKYSATGFPQHRCVLSNTSRTISLAAGLGYPLPTVGSTAELFLLTTRIVPPVIPCPGNSSIYFRGNSNCKELVFSQLRSLIFDNGAGPAGRFISCDFFQPPFSLAAVESGGFTQFEACFFDKCDTGVGCYNGMTWFLDNLHRTGTYAIWVQYNGTNALMRANSAFSLINVTAAIYLKQFGAMDDESERLYLSGVRDYLWVQRGGKYKKINQSLTGMAAAPAVSRNVVRVESGGAFVDLTNTPAATITASGAYIHFNGTDFTLNDYTVSGFEISNHQNIIFDGAWA